MFRLEMDLVASLRERPSDLFRRYRKGCRAMGHVQVGPRIPDLLLVYGAEARRTRVKATYFDCAIMSVLMTEGPQSDENVANTLYASVEQVGDRIRRLAAFGLVGRRRDGTASLRRGVLPRNVRIIAIEAKLDRWKDAVEQAKSYFEFANESYIAMPESRIRHHEAARELCAASGVGVLSVADDRVTIVSRSRLESPTSADWIRLISSHVGVMTQRDRKQNAMEVGDQALCEG